MKISIITATKNNKAGLMRAIESVRSQTYKNVEHIIVDGLSTDGTEELIKNLEFRIKNDDNNQESSRTNVRDLKDFLPTADRLTPTTGIRNDKDKVDFLRYFGKLSTGSLITISEADSGIYDAINKGIKLATGDVVGLLHSDDFFADEFVLERVAEAFQDKRIKGKDKRILSSREEARDHKDFLPTAGRLTPAGIRNDKDKGDKEPGNNGRTTDDPIPTTDNLPPTIDAVYSDLVYVNQKSKVKSQKSKIKGQISRSEQKLENESIDHSALKIEHSVIRTWKTHKVVSSDLLIVNGEQKSIADSEQRIVNSTEIPKQPFDRLRVTHFDSPDGSGQVAQDDNDELPTTNNQQHTTYYSPLTTNDLLNGWMPPHPTLFVRKEIFEKYGLYRTDMKIAADYEMVLRLFYKHKITAHYLPLTTYCMTIGGASNKSLKNIFIKSNEDYRAMKMHGIPFPLKTLFLKNVRKLPQFFQ